MRALGVNTIRVYTVDGSRDHDACMQTFASQGIYVWIDLSTPTTAISRVNPSWTMDLYQNWTGTVDAFAKYDNLLTFGVGQELINDVDTVAAAPYVKAAARDIKAFRDARQYRKIPIAYSAADVSTYRVITGEYFSCGKTDDTIDIYGMNLYSWCGNSSVYAAGYDTLYENFQDFNIPVVFSETGCNTDGRDFSDVATMLGTVFPATFSGAIVYEWAEEANNYGIVSYSRSDEKGYPTTLSDYNALKTVLADASPVGTSISAYTPSNTPPACPTSNSDWPLNGDVSLPTIVGLDIATITPSAITTNASPSTSTASALTGSAVSTATGIADQVSSETSHGLSTATIAGISIGAIAVVAAAAIGAIFIFHRRSAKAKSDKFMVTENARSNNDDMTEFEKSELPGISVARVIPKSELDADTSADVVGPATALNTMDRPGAAPQELPYTQQPQRPVEMEGSSPVIQELDTSNNASKSIR